MLLLYAPAKRYWYLLTLGIFAGIASIGAEVSFPLALKFLVDDVLTMRHSEKLMIAVLFLACTGAGTAVCQAAQGYIFAYLSGRVGIDVRNRLALHKSQVSFSFLNEKRCGDMIALFSSDVPMVERFYESVIGPLLISVLRFIVTWAMVFVLFRKLVLWTALAIPVYAIVPVLLTKRIRQAAQGAQQSQAAMLANLQESISASRDLKVFNREPWDQKTLKASFEGPLKPRMRLAFFKAASLAGFLVFWCIAGLIYWLGGQKAIEGKMTVGSLIACVGYFSMLFEPVQRVVNLNQEFQTVTGAVARILDFLREPTVIFNVQRRQQHLQRYSGEVRFDRVCFSYDTLPVLEDVTFEVAGGQRIALVGPSGSGKTTIVSLLLRLLEPTRGRVFLGDNDIRDIGVESLRQCVSVAFHDSTLLSGTVNDNILFGNLQATESDVMKAAELANAHEFILRLPKGYDTYVGERGVLLSAGQKQRIAIARALLCQPRLLILDEATSSVDYENETAIQRALNRAMKGRCTTVMVTHKLSSITDSDCIILLNRGRIVEMGNHIDLLHRSDLYSSYFMSGSWIDNAQDVTKKALSSRDDALLTYGSKYTPSKSACLKEIKE